MNMGVTRMDVEAAIEDIRRRTLTALRGEFAQLIYLASTRDYNSGRYFHDGLALQFGQEVAEQALATCHNEVFHKLALTSLESLIIKIETYLISTGAEPARLLAVWQRIEPYRVAIPLGADTLSSRLFLSNVKVALAILQARRRGPQRP